MYIGPYCTEILEEEYKDNIGRPSAAKRGYGYQWRKKRDEILQRDKMCVKCKKEKATNVDHIRSKAKGGHEGPSNLQGLCASCHSRKTATTDRRRPEGSNY